VLEAHSHWVGTLIALEKGDYKKVNELSRKALELLKKSKAPYDEAIAASAAEASDAEQFSKADYAQLKVDTSSEPWASLIAIAKKDGTPGLVKELRTVVSTLEESTNGIAQATAKGKAPDTQLAHEYVATWANAMVRGEAISRLHHALVPANAAQPPEKAK
jgi:hypothetical protein